MRLFPFIFKQFRTTKCFPFFFFKYTNQLLCFDICTTGQIQKPVSEDDRDRNATINSALADTSYADLEAGTQTQEDGTEIMLKKFQEETDALRKAIAQIMDNVETIDSMYEQTLQKEGDPDERREVAAKITTLVAQSGKISQAVRKRLRRIAEENETYAKEEPSSVAAVRIRLSTHQVITQSFMNTMQKFEDAQDRHQEAVKLAMERQLRIMNPDATDEDIEKALKRGETDQVIEDSPMLCELPPEEQKRLRAELDILASRNKDIRELERNIVDLHQMFIDMQLLVEQQGDLLNTIEYNVQDTKGRAETGMHELVRAYDFQKRAKRKKWCVAILIIAIITAIAVPLLVKFIPVWFPETEDAINNIPIIGPGNDDAETPISPSPNPSNAPESDAMERLPVSASIYSPLNSPCAAVGSKTKC